MAPLNRFIGIDFGSAYTSICRTMGKSTKGEFPEPSPVEENHIARLPGVIAVPQAGKPVFVGNEILHAGNMELQWGRITGNLKNAFFPSPADLADAQLFFKWLYRLTLREIGCESLSPAENTVVLGVPSRWKGAAAAEALQAALEQAGFAKPVLCPEAYAPIYSLIHQGQITSKEEDQSWIVVDLGSQGAHISFVEKQSGKAFQLQDSIEEPLSGDEFDCALFDRWILPAGNLSENLTETQRTWCLLKTREIKENLSLQLAQNDLFKTRFAFLDSNVQLTIRRAELERQEMCGGLIQTFGEILRAPKIQDWVTRDHFDALIFVGGGAGWYFVEQLAQENLPEGKWVRAGDPGLTTAKGLALSLTGFRPEVKIVAPAKPKDNGYDTPAHGQEPVVDVEPKDYILPPDFSEERKGARKIALRMALIGGAFALLVSPIPGASSAGLIVLEAFMFYEIGKKYGFRLSINDLGVIFVLLLVVSFVVKLAVTEVLTFVPILGWAIKGCVAAGIIYGLGFLAQKLFEKKIIQPDFKFFK